MHKNVFGTEYFGEWLNGIAHGKGALISQDNKLIVEGDFVDGWIRF